MLLLEKHKDAVGMANKKFSQHPWELLPVKDLLHFDVDLPPCMDRTELLSATESKHPFLPPRLDFWRAEGWFSMRKCSSWMQPFSAARAGLALLAPGCM